MCPAEVLGTIGPWALSESKISLVPVDFLLETILSKLSIFFLSIKKQCFYLVFWALVRSILTAATVAKILYRRGPHEVALGLIVILLITVFFSMNLRQLANANLII
jgi:hypothetical protein